MTFEVRAKCVICRKLADPTINSVTETNAESLNILHSKLCLALKLEFSPEFQEWDFADEPFPYCESCSQRLQRLGKLIDQLKSIEEEISESLATVSALVITSDHRDSDNIDPLITPKLGQAKEYFKSRRLQEKHSYFRSLIIQRYDPRVKIEPCDISSDLGLSEKQYDYDELLPQPILLKTEPNFEEPPDIAAEEFITINDVEYKVDTSTDLPFVLVPETIIGLEHTWTSSTEPPALSLALNQGENLATTTLTSANDPGLVKHMPSKLFPVTFDETFQTYELNGFKFKELELGSFECCTCGNVCNPPKGRRPRSKLTNIKQHIKIIHMGVPKAATSTKRVNSPRKCEECGKLCSSIQKLRQHRVSAHRPPRFQCDQCGTKFKSLSKLKEHMQIHSEQRERPFSCDQCGKTFFRKKHLKVHSAAVHTSERPEQCSFCCSKLKTQVALRRHIRAFHAKHRPELAVELL